jgi:hypothetical protein
MRRRTILNDDEVDLLFATLTFQFRFQRVFFDFEFFSQIVRQLKQTNAKTEMSEFVNHSGGNKRLSYFFLFHFRAIVEFLAHVLTNNNETMSVQNTHNRIKNRTQT